MLCLYGLHKCVFVMCGCEWSLCAIKLHIAMCFMGSSIIVTWCGISITIRPASQVVLSTFFWLRPDITIL